MEDCKTLKYKVRELIGNKLLALRRNGSRVDVLINRPCNAKGEGSPVPMVIPYSEESNKGWDTTNTNILKASGLVKNDSAVASGRAKGVDSSSEKKIPKYDKGHSSVVPCPRCPYDTLDSIHIPCNF